MKAASVDPFFESAYRVGIQGRKIARVWHSGLTEGTLNLMRLGLLAGAVDRLRGTGWDVKRAFAAAMKKARATA